MRCHVACLVLLLTGAVETQAQVLQAAIDTVSVRVLESERGGPTVAEVDSVTGLSPRGALLRSALIPGWGQLSQGHPWKAMLFSGAGIGWLSAALADAASVGASAATVRQDRAARRNTRVLFYVITATLAGLDAYVDAHLDDFHLEADPFAMAGAQLTLRF